MYCYKNDCKCSSKQTLFNPNHCGRHAPKYPKRDLKRIKEIEDKIFLLSLSNNIDERQQATKILQKRKDNYKQLIPEEQYDNIIYEFLKNTKE